MTRKIISIFAICALYACKSSKPVIVTSKDQNRTEKNNSEKNKNKEVISAPARISFTNDVVNNYVLQYKDIAMSNMKTYGIPASIILAQGILESGAGQGNLAQQANNHFGIKCHNDWKGQTIYQDDDRQQECFRKYNDPRESYSDHAIFLTSKNRYYSLFSLPKDDYESWAKGLRAAGYATDIKYPEKLISYIEKYNLAQYDKQVLGGNYVGVSNKTVSTPSAPVVVNTPAPSKPAVVNTPAPSKPVVVNTPAPSKPAVVNTPAPSKPAVVNTPAPSKPAVVNTPAPSKPVVVNTPAPSKPVVVNTPAPSKPVVVNTPAPTKPVEEVKTVTTIPTENKVVLAPNEYQVVTGDTMYSVSKKFGLLVEELKRLNNLTDFSIQVGQILKIK